MSSLYKASEQGSRLDQLIELRNRLAYAIDECESMRDLAALSRQYRETIKEIEELDNGEADDEIAQILGDRDGMPGAVRANRS